MIEKYDSFEDTDTNLNVPNNGNMLSIIMEDIIDAIIITEKASKVPTFTHVVTEFVHSLSYIQIWIMWKKLNATENTTATSHMLGVITWISRGLMLEIILCVSCNRLYEIIESIRLSALLLLQKSCSKEDRRLSLNILRALNIRYRKISACGVFIVDATLPLRFSFVLVNHLIVLLQFAFL
ncbi:uncharacterized protein LOC121731368 [Aricia agestis]|uniref:uncharacterized protein LOC121731368 n=1 Tax=Aricia agestis TaxID=91739 RepID=UPI001C205608|nr:uncharacterized protein LOC121731368 [Aricia agestis]